MPGGDTEADVRELHAVVGREGARVGEESPGCAGGGVAETTRSRERKVLALSLSRVHNFTVMFLLGCLRSSIDALSRSHVHNFTVMFLLGCLGSSIDALFCD